MNCTVQSVHNVGTRYRQIRFIRAIPGFQIIPGQFVKVFSDSSPSGHAGYFAVVNFKNSSEFIDLLIAPTNPGGVSTTPSVADILFRSEQGQVFELSAPDGKGFPEPRQDGYALVAGGSGIAAILPVFEWAAVHGVPCSLLYYDREGQHAYRDMIACVSGTDLMSNLWNTSRLGRPVDILAAFGDIDITRRRLCVCGPQDVSNAVIRSLYSRGLEPHEHINKNF